ncbi:MAG: long-chain-fatty-acid--CoA ligase [Candidatus Omnitrophica bacterium]|nr:long-chain-fatty-acid--CoA ligase [Candidatus Omnitrophota bacterium]
MIRTLEELLDATAARFPDRIYIEYGAKKITYCQAAAVSRKFAQVLRDRGVTAGDRVALWLPNCPEFVFAFFAVLRAGAVAVPVNTLLLREEARYIVEDAGAKVMVCSAGKAQEAKNILSRVPSLEWIAVSPGSETGNGVFSFWELVRAAEELQEGPPAEPLRLAEIVYTSGTTGRPKGACLTHRNLLANVNDCAQVIRANKRDVFICLLPLFHSFASTVCMLLPCAAGAKTVILRSVRPFKRVVRTILRKRVTVFIGVPSLYGILSEMRLPFARRILAALLNPVRVCISGAAALPPQVTRRFEKKFRRPLLQGYGLTEASPVVSLNPLKGRRVPESVGVSLPSVRVRIEDPRGNECAPGEVGELVVSGPNVMQGYFHLDEATARTLRNGWLYTGDLAKKDTLGFLYIMGRAKEMINVRGLNVYPREIEEVLYRCPGVHEAAVVGVMHRRRGEVPVAFVAAEAHVEERRLMRHLRESIASYKVPLRIIKKPVLPKNPTGKIVKSELQREASKLFTRGENAPSL